MKGVFAWIVAFLVVLGALQIAPLADAPPSTARLAGDALFAAMLVGICFMFRRRSGPARSRLPAQLDAARSDERR